MKKSLSVLMVILAMAVSFLLTACDSAQSYKIYFIIDSNVISIISTKGNEAIVLPDEPTKNGHTFEGWYFDKDIWNEELTEDYFFNKKLTRDVDVYAKWNKIPTFTLSVIYDCSLAKDSNTQDLDGAIETTITKLSTIIQNEYSNANITRQSQSQIKIDIELPSITGLNKMFELIGEPTPLYMTLEENGEARLTGKDIEDFQASYQKGSSGEFEPGVLIKFTKEGAEKFANLTGEAASGSQKIYIYLGDISEENLYQAPTCESKITGGSTFISGSFETYEAANEYALKIFSGSLDVKLQLNSYSFN